MAINDVINPRCYRNCFHSCLSFFPEWVLGYAAVHMDTIPKFLNHVVFLMALSNFMFILSSTMSFLTFLSALLLSIQNISVLLVLNHDRQRAISPRFLAPTDFMIGVCLGISIGGTILAFFVARVFSVFHRYCQQNECESETRTINAIWFWSSLTFWLNVVTCILLAAARNELATSTAETEYQSIGSNHDSDSMSGSGGVGSYHQQRFQGQHLEDQPSSTSFAQPPNSQASSGAYSNVPDVHTERSQVLPQAHQTSGGSYPQQLSV